jgi:hypothetical protein
MVVRPVAATKRTAVPRMLLYTIKIGDDRAFGQLFTKL